MAIDSRTMRALIERAVCRILDENRRSVERHPVLARVPGMVEENTRLYAKLHQLTHTP